jgi:hypothetical protein
MASEEAIALTLISVMAFIALGGPWVLVLLSNYGSTGDS